MAVEVTDTQRAKLQETGLNQDIDRVTDRWIKWADLSTEEQVERCRNQIKQQANAISELRRQLQLYENHVHQDETGAIFIPMFARRGYGHPETSEGDGGDGREWF